MDKSGLVLSEGSRALNGPEESEQQIIEMSMITIYWFCVKIGLFKHFHCFDVRGCVVPSQGTQNPLDW